MCVCGGGHRHEEGFICAGISGIYQCGRVPQDVFVCLKMGGGSVVLMCAGVTESVCFPEWWLCERVRGFGIVYHAWHIAGSQES